MSAEEQSAETSTKKTDARGSESSKPSHFEICREMACRNLDIRMSLLENVTNLSYSKRTKGTTVSIGVDGDLVGAIFNNKFIGGLLLCDREQYLAISAELSAPAPSPGVTSEQVRVDCKACGGEQVEHTCHRKWKTIRNKSEAGVTSEQVGTCGHSFVWGGFQGYGIPTQAVTMDCELAPGHSGDHCTTIRSDSSSLSARPELDKDEVLTLGPPGKRVRDQQEWLTQNHPECQREQKHLDEGSTERAYWHYGYMVGLRDVLNYLTGKSPSDKG